MNLPEISCTEAYERSSETLETDVLRTVLVDVREADEWSAGHGPGAIHRSLGSLDPPSLAAAFPAGVTVMCLCRSGGRSARAVAILRSAGIDAINVIGGMNAWAAADLPIVAEDLSPAKVL